MVFMNSQMNLSRRHWELLDRYFRIHPDDLNLPYTAIRSRIKRFCGRGIPEQAVIEMRKAFSFSS